jgi:tetratricopeptide (TPR) repeat protein
MQALLLLLSMAVPLDASWQASLDAGEAAYRRFDYTAAERSFNEAAAFAERFGSRDPRRAETLVLLGDVRLVLGKDTEAESAYVGALQTQERALGPSDPQRNRVLWNLFAICTVQGKRAEAGAYFKRLAPEPLRLPPPPR